LYTDVVVVTEYHSLGLSSISFSIVGDGIVAINLHIWYTHVEGLEIVEFTCRIMLSFS